MRRALMFLNLYDHEAVRHKLKNGLKTPKNAFFFTVFELMSDSFMAMVEPDQCPLHQSILLIQGPIHEIFTKKY